MKTVYACTSSRRWPNVFLRTAQPQRLGFRELAWTPGWVPNAVTRRNRVRKPPLTYRRSWGSNHYHHQVVFFPTAQSRARRVFTKNPSNTTTPKATPTRHTKPRKPCITITTLIKWQIPTSPAPPRAMPPPKKEKKNQQHCPRRAPKQKPYAISGLQPHRGQNFKAA